MMATRTDRRISRPYYRYKRQHDWVGLMGASFVVGCMLGATLASWLVGMAG